MKDVNNKVAFITGGASGVGLGMARVFHKAGMRVMIADIRPEFLDEARAAFAGQSDAVRFIQVDITDRRALTAAAEATVKAFGKVHVLCNNAGINIFKTVEDTTYSDWDWIVAINLTGVFNGVKSFVPHIRAHGEGGHIVNTASMAALAAGPSAGAYTATKFGVRGLSESLRLSLAQYHIGVSVLCPGLVNSRIYKTEELRPENLYGADYRVDAEFMQRLEQVHQIGMDPIEVGEKVLRGIQRNDLFILSHPDHKEEVQILCDEIVASFPDEPPEPRRMEFEKMRRKAADEIKDRIKSDS
jgi:NAD(P)-dependent dehydrogenase (short-subunit alcohol dehydrogenase family)